jgi:hypothetical protein
VTVIALLRDVTPIEGDGPRASAVERGLPQLADAAVRFARPGDALNCRPFWRVLRLALQDHAAVNDPALHVQRIAAFVNPRLGDAW